jgi:hypothetical protein
MCPNEGSQEHLVRDTEGQWGSKKNDGYRAESEIRVMFEVRWTDN